MSDRQKIRDFLTTLVGKEVQFGDGDSLLTTQIIDSLKVAELVVFLETTYKVSLNPDELTPDNLDTINAIVAFLERKGILKSA